MTQPTDLQAAFFVLMVLSLAAALLLGVESKDILLATVAGIVGWLAKGASNDAT